MAPLQLGPKLEVRQEGLMSWGFKDFEEITSRGTSLFVVLDSAAADGVRPHLLRDDHDAAKELALPNRVPQSIRDYFDGARMLWLHGWFYYPFYSMAAVHTCLCMELALKERLRLDGITLPKHERTFAGMLEFAIDQKWFAPRGFATIVRRIEREALFAEDELEATGVQDILNSKRESERYTDMLRLLRRIRRFRNLVAHPEGLTLLLPNMTYAQIEFVRDAIAQLFSSSRES